jgi:cyanophycinase
MNDIYNYSGNLIIIGGGDIPEEIFDLFSELIGGKDSPIVVIPTATEDELWIQAAGHLQKFLDRGFNNLNTVHTRSKDEANSNQRFIELIRNCKGLFFGGGDQQFLADIYGNTILMDEFKSLLQRGGVVMGTSAGATIMGSLLIGGDARDDITVKYDFQSAFSFMKNTAIDQHVLARNRQFDLIPVVEHYNVLGIGIDESTAIIVDKDKFKVIGLSYILLYDPDDWKNQTAKYGKVIKPFTMMKNDGSSYNFNTKTIDDIVIDNE